MGAGINIIMFINMLIILLSLDKLPNLAYQFAEDLLNVLELEY